jgi:hypothetical protein
MNRNFSLRCVAVAALVLAGVAGRAQTAPAGTVDEALLAMAARAGVIFAGTVVSVQQPDNAGYVDIRFRIDEAVRGCPAKGFYVLREWAGLWTGGSERYRTGQRLLMLLYARGPSGISSPVNGQDGAIPILPGGVAPIADTHGVAPADAARAPAESLIDLRWVQAETLRTITNPSVHPLATSTEIAWPGPVAPIRILPAPVPTALPGQLSYSAVMSLLHAGGGTITPVANPVRHHASN